MTDNTAVVAYLVEGFDAKGKLYAKIVQFTVDEARNSAAEFARHYSTVSTTPLARAPVSGPSGVPRLDGKGVSPADADGSAPMVSGDSEANKEKG